MTVPYEFMMTAHLFLHKDRFVSGAGISGFRVRGHDPRAEPATGPNE